MAISEGVKEVVVEMIKIQQLLRGTSPSHRMSEGERAVLSGCVERAEQALKRVSSEASPR